MVIDLPYPPHPRKYWSKGSDGKKRLAKDGLVYRHNLSSILNGKRKFSSKVDLNIKVFSPFNQVSPGNPIVPLLDGLKHGGLIQSGKNIDFYCVENFPPCHLFPMGKIIINIKECP